VKNLTKRPEIRTCSVTYHSNAMYQVSVEYVKRYGNKSKRKPQVRRMDGRTQMESEPIVPSGETVRGLIMKQISKGGVVLD